MTTQTRETPTLAGQTDVPWRALPVLMAGVFLCVLDFFIVNVALPSMQSNLHASSGEIEWVVAGYGLALAVFLLASGRIGDQIGRRRSFMIGIAAFVAASAVCVVAPNPSVLIAARLAQGVGGALITTSVLSLIGVLYVGAARARAIGIYGVMLGISATGGQLIGGALIDADVAGLGWRAIFAINVPIGVAALILAPILIQESRAATAAKLDIAGMVLMTLTMTTLMLPLIEGRQAGWPLWTWLLLALVPVMLAVTVLQQRRLGQRGGAPLFPGVLLTERTFRAGLIWQLAFWCGQASMYFVLALYLQQGRDLSALESGLVFTSIAVPYLAASLISPKLGMRYGRRILVSGGAALLVGYAALIEALLAGVDAPLWLIVPGLAFLGIGQGLCIPPSTALVLAHAKPTQAGAVSGAMSTIQQIGNCVGVAVIGVLFFGAANIQLAFGLSILGLVVIALIALGLTRLLPRAAASGAGR